MSKRFVAKQQRAERSKEKVKTGKKLKSLGNGGHLDWHNSFNHDRPHRHHQS
jgi:hypothetical protein